VPNPALAVARLLPRPPVPPAPSNPLADLIARAAAGDGEDRGLDFDIRRAADPDFLRWHRWALREAVLHEDGWDPGCGRKKLGPIPLRLRKPRAVALYRRLAADATPRFTASLDAAATLHEVLPDAIPSAPRRVVVDALSRSAAAEAVGGGAP